MVLFQDKQMSKKAKFLASYVKNIFEYGHS